MPYISQLLNNKITDSADSYIGRLDDILIAPKEGEFAPLEYLAVKNGGGRIVYVPYECVENFTSSEISPLSFLNSSNRWFREFTLSILLKKSSIRFSKTKSCLFLDR